jgi:hypothetical protein
LRMVKQIAFALSKLSCGNACWDDREKPTHSTSTFVWSFNGVKETAHLWPQNISSLWSLLVSHSYWLHSEEAC